MWFIVSTVAAAVLLIGYLLLSWFGRWGEHWGATPEEFDVCRQLERGACPVPFAIVALDPATMATEDLYVGGGPPMGAGTVGLQVGRELFIGSFTGDRVLRVRLPADASQR